MYCHVSFSLFFFFCFGRDLGSVFLMIIDMSTNTFQIPLPVDLKKSTPSDA
jgi:hypothetical protein